MAELMKEARNCAVDVLCRCIMVFGSRPAGLSSACIQERARSNALTGLYALLCGSAHLRAILHTALDAPGTRQSTHSKILHYVVPETDEISTELCSMHSVWREEVRTSVQKARYAAQPSGSI